MWPMLVVPSKIAAEFPAKRRSALRDESPASNFVLHGSDEAFHHRDAPVFSDRAKPRANCVALAPSLEGLAPEDTVFVADQILGRGLSSSDRPSEKRACRQRVRPLGKDREAHRASRIVVNDNGQPPTERPALW